MNITKLKTKIESEIKEYGCLIFNMELPSEKLSNYSFNIEVTYNKNFSENIQFIIRNRKNDILRNITVNLKDLDYALNIINKEVL